MWNKEFTRDGDSTTLYSHVELKSLIIQYMTALMKLQFRLKDLMDWFDLYKFSSYVNLTAYSFSGDLDSGVEYPEAESVQILNEVCVNCAAPFI